MLITLSSKIKIILVIVLSFTHVIPNPTMYKFSEYVEVTWRNALEDDEIMEMLAEDIREVEESSGAGIFEAIFIEYDLNDDDLLDLLLYVRSSVHSGASRSPITIFKMNSDGTYAEIGGGLTKVAFAPMQDEGFLAKIYISNGLLNGFKTIKIQYVNGESDILYYEGGKYQWEIRGR